jgi:hypothetical protein
MISLLHIRILIYILPECRNCATTDSYVKLWPYVMRNTEIAEADELLFCFACSQSSTQHPVNLLHHLHHQLKVYASATTRLPSLGGVTREACTISFPCSLTAHARLECIPPSTSSSLPPSQHTLHAAAPASLDPPAAHSALPLSWPLRLLPLCSMRPFRRQAQGLPSLPTFKRRDTTISMAKALSIPGTRTSSVAQWS